MEISPDRLVPGENIAQDTLEDHDLLTLFNMPQKFSVKQTGIAKDVLSAFMLKTQFTQKISQ